MRTALTRDKQKRRRAFRLECLEGRELLSHVKPPTITAEVVRTPGPIPLIRGHVVLIQGSAGEYYQTPPGFVSFGGHGTAVPLGNIEFGTQEVVRLTGTTPAVSVMSGTALLNTNRGETITLAFTGAGQPGRGKVVYALNGSITSGTGRFGGVTGTFAGTATNRGNRVALDFVLVPMYPTIV